MLTIRFTAQDLLRTRFAPAPAPLVEVALAATALCRNDRGLLGPWLARMRQVLPADARPLLELVSDARAFEYLWVLDHDFDGAIDSLLSQPPRSVLESAGSSWVRRLGEGDREAQAVLERALRSAQRAFGAECARIHATFHTDLAHRKEILLAHGLGAALETVFRNAVWSGDTLEIPYAHDLELDLGGHGVVLLPTAFRIGTALIGSSMPGLPRVIVYPAHVPTPLLDSIGRTPSLTPLIGRTRSAVLATITSHPSSTTSQIAARLGISPGRASEHAGVLRDAGLITSHRHRNTVRHLPTQLGREIG